MILEISFNREQVAVDKLVYLNSIDKKAFEGSLFTVKRSKMP